MSIMDLASVIRNIPNFPKPGIQFKDITTLLLEPEAFRQVIETFVKRYHSFRLDALVGIEARGFVFGGALAYTMGLPFVLARKPGKLPGDTIQESFALEYGTDTVAMHRDAIKPEQRVLIVDDLLATGGTVAAVSRLVGRLGGNAVEAAFVIELPPLKGREKVAPLPVFSLVEFMVE
ncbi:MAG TPA: adenine phosphoribosyltransferase [Candidatus Hydrogenedentes bacterium]|nr:adenine phosphoribosyltransferase [Candidatus Hydrogenedentota bacterium]HQN01059.1 adenine phosphoribosyltransferase [Candidatus Hydrogenedentota bacterium]